MYMYGYMYLCIYICPTIQCAINPFLIHQGVICLLFSIIWVSVGTKFSLSFSEV